ncbi:zeta toxin family protein, partial [Enterococcus faecalis]|uniref:zeta toxin family protein n=1 Tax=Enterococcus faecalis TaxID=1351 RepID=UPI000D441541
LAVESPTAFLLGGQPGSGKTSLRSAIFEETQGNVIVIDNDTFKRFCCKVLNLLSNKVE